MRFATLRARLMLAGWTLTRSDASDGPVIFYACRWNMPRELADLAAVEAFADRVVGASKKPGTIAATGPAHPLLSAPCTCSLSAGPLCLTCTRWHRHYRTVLRRGVSGVSEHLRGAD